jgi:hypothetical protein
MHVHCAQKYVSKRAEIITKHIYGTISSNAEAVQEKVEIVCVSIVIIMKYD